MTTTKPKIKYPDSPKEQAERAAKALDLVNKRYLGNARLTDREQEQLNKPELPEKKPLILSEAGKKNIKPLVKSQPIRIREVYRACATIEPVTIKEITPEITDAQAERIAETLDKVNQKYLHGGRP